MCWVRRQRVHSVIRFFLPSTMRVTGCMFVVQLRLVWRLEWLTLWPNCGVLSQRSHFTGESP